MGGTTPQYRATEARFQVEAQRVTACGHAQRIGQQQRNEGQGMGHHASDGNRDQARQKPRQGLQRRAIVTQFGLGHRHSIEIVARVEGNRVLSEAAGSTIVP